MTTDGPRPGAAEPSVDDVHRRLLQGTYEALLAAAALAEEVGVEAARRRAERDEAVHRLDERHIEHRASLVGLQRALDHPHASYRALDGARRAAAATEALIAPAERAVEDADRQLEALVGRVSSVASLLPADERPDGDVLIALPVIGARLKRHAAAVAAALDETSEWLATALPA